MKLVVVLALYLVGSVSEAYWRKDFHFYPVVKIKAGVKGMPPRFVGSGLTFRYNQELYVLTSDHTVARAKNGFLHTVSGVFRNYNAGIYEEYQAEFVFSDWGRRFALLKIINPPADVLNSKELPDFHELHEEEKMDWIGFHYLAGYPAASKTCSWEESSGSIKLTEKYPLLALQVEKFWEESYLNAEFGMSGGALYVESRVDDHMRLVGLISHQIYVEGRPDEMTPGSSSTTNTILIIPFRSIDFVIEDYLKNKSIQYVNYFEQPGSSYKFETLESGVLNVASWRDDITGRIDKVGVDYFPKRIPRSTINNEHLLKAEAALKAREGKLNPSTPNSLNIIGWRTKGQFQKWSGYSVQNMVEFMRMMSDPTLEPVIILSYENIDTIRENIKKHHSNFAKPCVNVAPSPELEELCTRLYWISNATELPFADIPVPYYRWAVLKPSDMDDLLNNPKYTKAWQSVPFGAGSRASVQALRDYLKDVTL